MLAIYQESDCAPTTALLVIALLTLALVAMVMVAWRRSRRREDVANSESASVRDPHRPLVEGEVVLAGVVAHLPDQNVAVRVEITQSGTESESSGRWSHQWHEVDRKVKVAPFTLVLADGTMVRVEPPPTVDLVDALDGPAKTSMSGRVLSAELVPDERVHARGWLERESHLPSFDAGYREESWCWVLRPSRGRMLLSSDTMGAGLRQRARFHRFYAWLAIAMLAGFHLSLVGFYQRALGEVEPATVSDHAIKTSTNSDNEVTREHQVTLQTDSGRRGRYTIEPADYALAEVGTKLAVLCSSDGMALGNRPTMASSQVFYGLGAVGFLLILYARRRKSTRPWFRRAVNNKGTGRLPNRRKAT